MSLPRVIVQVVVGLVVCGVVLGQEPGYYLFIDAGSSGSRLEMFNLAEGERLKQVSPSAEDEKLFEVEPGISSYTSTPEKAGESLAPLLEAAKKYIPEEQHSSTRLWVRATAGARSVGHDAIDPLFDGVAEYLKEPQNSPFKFEDASVLSGEEEGVFAWVSANSIIDKVHDVTGTHGIVDLGGASFQIAFNPGKNIFESKFSFYVRNLRRSIYAKSYMNGGMVVTTERAQKVAVTKAKEGASKIDFPCFFKDYSEDNEIEGKNYTFVGTGDPDACESLLDELEGGAKTECVWAKCALRGAYQAPVPQGKKFFAISALFFTANGLGLVDWNEAKAITPGALREAARTFCPKTQEEAVKASKAKWKYLKMYCMSGLYAHKMLNHMGFADDFQDLTFARKINGKGISWTYGAALYETELMPEARTYNSSCGGKRHTVTMAEVLPSPITNGGSEVAKFKRVSVGLGCVVVLLVAALAKMRWQMHKSKSASLAYQLEE